MGKCTKITKRLLYFKVEMDKNLDCLGSVHFGSLPDCVSPSLRKGVIVLFVSFKSEGSNSVYWVRFCSHLYGRLHLRAVRRASLQRLRRHDRLSTVRLITAAGDHRRATYYAVNLICTLPCTSFAVEYAFLSWLRPTISA